MENQSYRLVLIPPPFQGHITPMLQLATILHSKGFSITVVLVHFNSPDPSNYPNFSFLPLFDGLSDIHISSTNFIDITSTLNTKCIPHLKELLVDQMKKANAKHEKIACIIYDGLLYCIDSVARELKLPSIVFRTTSATNLLTYHAFAQLQSNGYLPVQDSRSCDLVPGLDPLRFKDLPIFNSTNPDVFLQQSAKTIAVTPLGVICNTVDCLEESSLDQLRQLYKVSLFPIGPLHLIAKDSLISNSFMRENYSCIDWLNDQARKSVLYISLGSIASWDEKELTEVAWGLANSWQNFLWVIRPGTINDVSEWLESLPEDVKVAVAKRGCIVEWAPQDEVLAHQAVGGFWSHCGWNSTLESLCEGVPILCQPYFGDQRVNARLLSHVWRVGLEWSNIIERNEIEGAVRRLMVNPEGKEMGQRAVELKDEIRLAVRGASSYDALNGLVKSIISVNL
ncbi:UDP-glucose iridoid glucosyltransferase-like [Gastrolobium bilobum]|uniref:UDP-glucose iridoid glucosyltransferase-like n=1 Tax=Gastrolobium bilobum TaxID=150636 RepID=UPI002AAFDF36|nr:UDP-glucose iridoid glucosyltransferase-like [Gastrolobium bilobum]